MEREGLIGRAIRVGVRMIPWVRDAEQIVLSFPPFSDHAYDPNIMHAERSDPPKSPLSKAERIA